MIGQHRLAIHLGVVEAIEEMNRTGAGGGDTAAEPAGVLRVRARHEGGGFLVPHLHESHLLLMNPERLHQAVNTVTGEAKDRINPPIVDRLNEDIGSRPLDGRRFLHCHCLFCHVIVSLRYSNRALRHVEHFSYPVSF